MLSKVFKKGTQEINQNGIAVTETRYMTYRGVFLLLFEVYVVNQVMKRAKPQHQRIQRMWVYAYLCILLFTLTSITAKRIYLAVQYPLADSEYESLHAIYNSTEGNYWHWNQSLTSTPWDFKNANANPCYDSWTGIVCNCSINICHIQKINLGSHNLSGVIPNEIGNFPYLTFVNMSNNYLMGTLPISVGSLTNLTTFIITHSYLTGTIPKELQYCAQLETFIISANFLSLAIPEELYTLTNLNVLEIGDNIFSGTISASLANLKNLKTFSAANNYLSGTLPTTLTTMKSLRIFIVDKNNITGTIPPDLDSLPHLQVFGIRDNFFYGTLPHRLGNCSQLEILHLSQNHFRGTIPTSLGNLTLLQSLWLYKNKLTGYIPPSLFTLQNMTDLELNDNGLFGTINPAIANLTKLKILSIQSNQFHGPFVYLFPNTSQLEFVNIGYNLLTGMIPSDIAKITTLKYLNLRNNHFTSTIPATLGTMSNLLYLNLNDNFLSGSLPNTIRWYQMKRLYVTNNRLTGSLPASLFQSCHHYQSIYLSNNFFTGNVSLFQYCNPQYFANLVIDHNEFTGSLPLARVCYNASNPAYWYSDDDSMANNENDDYVAPWLVLLNKIEKFESFSKPLTSTTTWETLTNYDVGGNYLTGLIPPMLFNSTKIELFYIYENYIHGTLPNFMFNCTGLINFHSSFNLFSGPIPIIPFNVTETFLPSYYSNVLVLQDFLVDHNFLTGTVPGELLIVQFLFALELQNNLLTGTIPEFLFTGFVDLSILFLQSNSFTGRLPERFSELRTVNFALGLTNIDISNNQLTGTIPTTIFSNFTYLQSFAAVSNCFSGSISETICEAPSLNALAFDGISTSEKCRVYLFPDIDHKQVLNAYYSRAPLTGGIPSCLFAMPKLTSLHLSGNGLTGSLPESLNLSLSLVDLSLSYNQLTGDIPEVIQRHGWKNLDLSYNKFGGKLIEGRFESMSRDGEASLNLKVNRLSSSIPSSLVGMKNISILQGNMFSCDVNREDIPYHDSESSTYSCGSDVTNSSLVVWMGLVCFVLTLLLIFVYRSFHEFDEVLIREQHLTLFWKMSRVFALLKSWRLDTVSSLPSISFLVAYFKELRNLIFVNTVILIVAYVPLYSATTTYDQTFNSEYVWTISALLLSGIQSGCVLIVSFVIFFFILLCLLRKLITTTFPTSKSHLRLEEDIATSLATVYPDYRKEELLLVQKLKRKMKQYLLVAQILLGFINVVVMILLDIVYVIIYINGSNIDILFMQIGLAAFKLFWNQIVLWKSIPYVKCHLLETRCKESLVEAFPTMKENLVDELLEIIFHDEDSISSQRQIVRHCITNGLNNIVIPFLAIAFVDPNCFYNMIVATDPVTAIYQYRVCDVFRLVIRSYVCFTLHTLTQVTTYDPPFTYSYQCSSYLVIKYIPVHIFSCIIVGILLPLSKIWLGYLEMKNLLPKETWWGRMLFSLLPSNLKKLQPALDTSLLPLFPKQRVITQIHNLLMIYCTFGLLFPPLAIMIGVTVMVVTVYEELVLGRLLVNARKEGYGWYELEVVKESGKVGDGMEMMMWMAVGLSSMMCGYVVFDTFGNELGWQGGFAPGILMVFAPITMMILLYYIDWKVYCLPPQIVTKTVEHDEEMIEMRETVGEINNPLQR